jgi:glucosamine-6-phosphate deaminase
MEHTIRRYGTANVNIYGDRDAMGKGAAGHVAGLIDNVLEEKDTVVMVFAAAPSQNEFLDHLTRARDIAWPRVIGFHMDEYIGLPADADQLFGRWLQEHLFGKVRMRSVHLIESQARNPADACEHYAELLRTHPIDIVCLGIGENGHIAFNDPPVADFTETALVKVVTLDEPCRMQQVHDGCFPGIEDVPSQALTLTVPALMSATYLSCVVPSERKAKAVRDALTGEISSAVPASILRTHPNVEMFLDQAAAKLL